MKLQMTILGLMLASSTVFAATNCDATALALAQSNLDSKAKAYGFTASNIITSSLKSTSQGNMDSPITYNVGGDIYKAEYNVSILLDSLCGVQSVTISEVGGR